MKMLHVGQPSRRGPCFSPRETHVFQAIFVRPCIGGAISHQPFIVHKLDEVSFEGTLAVLLVARLDERGSVVH